MKTKIDIRELKAKHRIECVMQATGESFDQSGRVWKSVSTPGLSVDTQAGAYQILSPGKNESGDVIQWLKARYGWTFKQAITFLQNRTPDPIQPADEVVTKTKAKPAPVVLAVDEERGLDRYQEKALEIAGERIRKYFAMDSNGVIYELGDLRIDPTIAPYEDECQRCKKSFDWNFPKREIEHREGEYLHWTREHVGAIPIIAYSIKKKVYLADETEGGAVYALFAEDTFDALYIEDEIVCERCAWQELDKQNALKLVLCSARKREIAEREATRQFFETEAARLECDSVAGRGAEN
jgi:hypothetical protein